MSQQALVGYMPLIESYAKGEMGLVDSIIEENRKASQAYLFNGDNYTFGSEMNNAPSGGTLVLPVKGPIMKESNCGMRGTAETMEILSLVDANPNIAEVIMDIDSPGGTSDGVFELADYIRNTFSKPIRAYVNSTAGSAGYALACACDEIILSHESASVGSIGVAAKITDFSKALEMNGITEHYITADGSEDKNKAFIQAKGGDYGAIKEEFLNPIREIFAQTVTTNRPNLNKEALGGKMYMGSDAIKMGLADKIMHISQVITSPDLLKQNQSIFMFNKFPKLAALKGVKSAELTEDQIATANREILENGIEGLMVVRENSITAEIEETENPLQATVTTQATRIAELEAEVARLGKIVPEGSTIVVKAGLDVDDNRGMELTEADKRLQAQAQAELSNMNL